jgi:hypothetical protein
MLLHYCVPLVILYNFVFFWALFIVQPSKEQNYGNLELFSYSRKGWEKSNMLGC